MLKINQLEEESKNTITESNLEVKKMLINKKGCQVWIKSKYLNSQDSKILFDHCKGLPFIRHKIKVRGKEITQPRLSCSIGHSYEYSHSTHPSSLWTKELEEIRDKVNQKLDTKFNSILVNYYRDGKDYISPHSDNISHLSNGVVAGISLGEERCMVLENKTTKEKIKFDLTNGSLFVMEGDTQNHWKHGIPKQLGKKRERISLTFREFTDS